MAVDTHPLRFGHVFCATWVLSTSICGALLCVLLLVAYMMTSETYVVLALRDAFE